MSDILIIGDTHFPFHSKKALKRVMDRLSEKKFSYVIQIGDLLDQYCFTRFPKQNIMLPDREIKYGRELALEMWDKIHGLQPQAIKTQLLGNHDVRLLKRIDERLPEAQTLVKTSLLELYRFKNVQTIEDPREEFILHNASLGDVAFLHGHLSKIGDHTRFMHMHTVHGHRHRGEVTNIPINGKTLFELDVGYLADINAEPLAYSPQRASNWTLGWGELDELGPRFIAF